METSEKGLRDNLKLLVDSLDAFAEASEKSAAEADKNGDNILRASKMGQRTAFLLAKDSIQHLLDQ